MKFVMSEENSKRVLKSFTYLSKIVQNYCASQNNSNNHSMSSGKKFINALLLTPIIVPTATTLSLIGCSYLCLHAVKAQDNDYTLSKMVKGIVRFSIYVVAFIVLSTCITLNLVISLIPFLIFLSINRDIFSQKSDNQTKSEKIVVNDSNEYTRYINDALHLLNSTELGNSEPIDEALDHTLTSPSQPIIQVISRDTGNPDQEDETIIVSNINNQHTQNGQMTMRIVKQKGKAHVACMHTADYYNRLSSATACEARCEIVEGGIDFSLSASARTGETQEEATNRLAQSEPVKKIVGDNGMLPITHHDNSQQI